MGPCTFQGLGHLSPDLVVCSTSSNIRPSVDTQLIPPQRGALGPAAAARGREGFGEHVPAPLRRRVLRASLQCQVPSDPSRGASAYARALAPSSPISFSTAPAATSSGRLPQALSHHTAHPSSKETSRAGSSSKGRGGVRRAWCRTTQVQGVEGLVAVPGAARPLPRGQRIRQGLGPLGSDLVVCSTSSNIIRAPPSGPESTHSSSPLKADKKGRQQQQGEGRGSASM